jgi:hypothetical protein
MLDAQLFLQNEAIAVVKQNYRLKVRMKIFITRGSLFKNNKRNLIED